MESEGDRSSSFRARLVDLVLSSVLTVMIAFAISVAPEQGSAPTPAATRWRR